MWTWLYTNCRVNTHICVYCNSESPLHESQLVNHCESTLMVYQSILFVMLLHYGVMLHVCTHNFSAMHKEVEPVQDGAILRLNFHYDFFTWGVRELFDLTSYKFPTSVPGNIPTVPTPIGTRQNGIELLI